MSSTNGNATKKFFSMVLLAAVILIPLLFIEFHFNKAPNNTRVTLSSIAAKPSNDSSNIESDKDKLTNEIIEKIGNKQFYNRDDYDYPYILKFDPSDNTGDGAITISHTMPPSDAQPNGLHCNYYFTYTIEGNRIMATFKNSDCGGTSPSMTFIYNKDKDNLSTTQSNGKKLVFTSL
jgi:hypothetical protein